MKLNFEMSEIYKRFPLQGVEEIIELNWFLYAVLQYDVDRITLQFGKDVSLNGVTSFGIISLTGKH